MLSDEEKAINELKEEINKPVEVQGNKFNTFILYNIESAKIVLNLIKKQSKEIEELKETLKCTQNSWYEDTIKIEEMKKQIDLNSECEIALNNRIMDLENADKKWEDKIKAKIEELDEEIKVKKEIARKPMDRVSGRLLTDNIVELEKTKKVLQSLLEKE